MGWRIFHHIGGVPKAFRLDNRIGEIVTLDRHHEMNIKSGKGSTKKFNHTSKAIHLLNNGALIDIIQF